MVADRLFKDNAFYYRLYHCVRNCAAAADLSVLMEIVFPQAEKNCTMPTFLVNHKVDGLIFMGEIDRRYLAAAIQHGLPFMLLDFYDDAIAADCVLSDNTSGSYMIRTPLSATATRWPSTSSRPSSAAATASRRTWPSPATTTSATPPSATRP